MKTGVNNLKKGNVILINNVLHEVIDYYNTQPGKGGAFSQIKLRNMDSGSIFEKRFRTSESVERAHLDDKEVQYLYSLLKQKGFDSFHHEHIAYFTASSIKKVLEKYLKWVLLQNIFLLLMKELYAFLLIIFQNPNNDENIQKI